MVETIPVDKILTETVPVDRILMQEDNLVIEVVSIHLSSVDILNSTMTIILNSKILINKKFKHKYIKEPIILFTTGGY